MDERSFLDVISGRRRGVAAALTRGLLSLAAPLYRIAMALRNWLFDAGWLTVQRAEVPVVSVGNITTGGTGKTPVVAWLANWCRSAGHPPILISRGYRALDEVGNDELRVLDQLCPGVPHLQGRDRCQVATRAVAEQRPDVLILDDAFQHRRLARDLDIVLIDALNPWGYGRLLPRGLLREPLSALRRADLIVLTRIDQVPAADANRLRERIREHCSAAVVELRFRPQSLLSLSGDRRALSDLQGQNVIAISGIGNPDGFRQTLQAAGFDLGENRFRSFPDHHHYTTSDLREIAAWGQSCSATALVTTQKDLVKLEGWQDELLPVWAVTIDVDFLRGREVLEAALQTLFAETGLAPRG